MQTAASEPAVLAERGVQPELAAFADKSHASGRFVER
jgi:hypothetical protein